MTTRRLVCPHVTVLLLLPIGILSCGPPPTPLDPAQAPGLFDDAGPDAVVLADELGREAASAALGHELVEGLALIRVRVGPTQMAHVRYRQTLDGVPVLRGDAVVHLEPDGAVSSVTDALLRGLDVDTEPAWTEDEAIDLAVAASDLTWGDLTEDPSVELWILRHEGQDHLTWRVQLWCLDGSERTSMPLVFIDAHDGDAVWAYDNLKSATGTSNYSGTVSFETHLSGSNYYLEDTTRDIGTYTFNNTSSRLYYITDPDDSWTSTSQREGVDAHYAAAETWDYFNTTFGRDGLDGSGGPGYISSLNGGPDVISLLVNYGNNYANAFYGDPYFIFGDGNGIGFDPFTTMDIVAHELTHAVTTTDVGLIYNGESGALDESYSDVFSAMVERQAYGESSDTWWIGEDMYTPGTSGDALRYMDDPTADGSSRDHYDDRYTGAADNGGVHYNSGIGNLAFYLVANGGSHPTYGGSMSGIGPDAAAAIWYEGLSYLTSNSDLSDARDAMVSGATDLYGSASAELTAVQNGWAMVGIGTAPTGDADGDGYDAIADGGTDCDDSDASVNPGATELCDGIDNDCDGTTDSGAADASTWYADADSDGFGDTGSSTDACEAPSGHVADATDCDDSDAGIHPASVEICDGVDNDCDGGVDNDALDAATWYADLDGDTHGDPGNTSLSCSQPAGSVADSTDCDDSDAAIHPGAVEVCDGADNDCDGGTDVGATDAGTWYADGDGDSYGDAGSSTASCEAPSGFVSDATDCNDSSAAVNPGATELCDGVDNDCDGGVDVGASDESTWYADFDGDTFGDAGATTTSCTQPTGFVADSSDCNDADPSVSPAAPEVCDGLDNDCDGGVDTGAIDAGTWYADADADSYGDAGTSSTSCSQPAGTVADSSDCDDGDAGINPGATEACDGADNDCDGSTDVGAADESTWYADDDGDSYGDASSPTDSCTAPAGHVADDTDCDDSSAAVNPGGTEVCDGLDNDCDGSVDVGATGLVTWYADADGDSYGDAGSTTESCAQPTGTVADSSDCDDSDAAVNPGAAEVCDGADNDCDGSVDTGAVDAGTWYDDNDGDSYGGAGSATASCAQPTGTVADSSDCDDSDAGINPAATEVCDGADNDCDGSADVGAADESTWYADADADSYGDPGSTTSSCDPPAGHVADDTDCDDSDAAVNPGATEVCDGADNDCDGSIDVGASDQSTWYADADGDGYGDPTLTASSCDQPSGFVADDTDCDDSDAGVNPSATEVTDGVDNDCNGVIDEGGASTCAGYDQTWSGNLSGTGDYDYQPDGSWYFVSTSGDHSGCLSGPAGTDFDLELYKWTWRNGWRRVAVGESEGSEETVEYSGSRGYYLWVVYSYSGSGDYEFGMTTP